MTRIGLIDEDGTRFPNLALMKLAAWHRQRGHTVEWYNPFDRYDCVYASKVFTFNKGYEHPIENADIVVKGGTGHSIHISLPQEVDMLQPDYTIYPNIGSRDAYGFLTRGCPNSCQWCIVPDKEGEIRPYMDIMQIAHDGHDHVTLMDNNILAAGDYAVEQLRKVIDNGIRIDFNQAMDARLVDGYLAGLLAKIKWLRPIRFGCDTHAQIKDCEKAMDLITAAGYKGEYILYTMLHGEIGECLDRVSRWKSHRHRVSVNAQPYRDRYGLQKPPAWQKDMARWANRRWIYRATDFKDYEPRKGFKCGEYY